MATVQFSRTLWQYSRCARLDLERSMVSSSSFLQHRSTFATVSSSHLNDIQSEASQSSYSDEHSELTEGVDFPKQRRRRVNADLGADVLSASEKQKRKETLRELVNAIHARAAADVSGSLSPSEIADLSKEPASLHSVEGSELLAGIEIRQRRKRRTKAEMLAAAAEQEALNPDLRIEIRQRRKRRTKAEMLAAAAEQEALNPKRRRRRRSGETEEAPKLGRPPGKGYRKPLPRPQKKSSSGTQLINMEADNSSGEIPFLNLPPMAQWKEVFSHVRESKRPTLRNPDTALMLADKIIPEGSKDKVIIEAFSGPGQLSRALLKLPRERIKKLIILESTPHYWKYVKPLEEIDDRVTVVQANARDWGTYTDLEKAGILNDVEIVDWEQVHPTLHFIMQMGSGVDGELVGAQLLRTVPDRQWLFKFGRMPMNFILPDRMWERFKAPEAVTKMGQARCKVSVMAQAVAHLSQTVPYDALQPYGEHFHPERYNTFEEKSFNLEKRRAGSPRVAGGFLPMAQPVILPGDLDYWDYVVRKLFVVKATPLERSISALGPGAYNMMKYLTNPEDPSKPFDVTKSPRSFTIQDWNAVVQAFIKWPFRPTDLGIEQMFSKKM